MAEPTVPLLRRKRVWLAALSVLFAAWLTWQLWPRPVTVGRPTTYLTGPLRPDGTVDYPAALDAEYAQGVTPENNAAVLLVEACGPNLIDAPLRSEFFRRLQLPVPSAQKSDLQDLDQFASELPGKPSINDLYDELSAARRSSWQPADHPHLAAWLTANEAALDVCVAASDRPRFYVPLIAPAGTRLQDISLQPLNQLRAVARLLTCRAALRLGSRDNSGALRDINALHRFSRLAARHPLLQAQLIARSLEASATTSDFTAITSTRLSQDEAQAQAVYLAALPEFPHAADLLDHGERCLVLDSYQWMQANGPYTPISLAKNAALIRVGEVMDECVQALRTGDFVAQRASLRQIAATQTALSQTTWMSAPGLIIAPTKTLSQKISSQLSALAISSWEQSLTSEYRQQTQQRALQIGYALARHRATHGIFPDSLSALVPTYLPELPNDTFTAQPFHYEVRPDHQKFLLYSLGPNGQDDRGRSNNPADDIAWGDVPQD